MEEINNKNKNILLGTLIVGIISMSVAFAALTTRLSINGTANVAAMRWNIHFQSWELATGAQGTTGNTNTAVYPAINQLTMQDNSNVTKVTGINVTLKQPGDYAKYTFQIINEGTINAKLDTFETNITNNSSGVIGYTVNCYSTQAKTEDTLIDEGYVLSANNGKVYCDLMIEYNDRSNSHTAGTNQIYEQPRIEAEASAEWIWVQDDGSGAQTSAQTGSNTPSSNYLAYKWNDVTRDGYGDAIEYYESDDWRPTLNPQSTAYLRTDGTKFESCGVFPNGVACTTSIYYNSSYSSIGNYESDFENCHGEVYDYDGTGETCLKGYTKEKANEILSKGASTCDVLDGYYGQYLKCHGEDGMALGVYANGGSAVFSYDNTLYVESDGTAY